MELNEFWVFDGETSTGDHTTAVTGAGMCRRAALVSSAISTSGDDSLIGLHPVDGSIGHVVGNNSSALTLVHQQVHCEILNEEDAVVTECTTEKSVEHRVTSAVSDGAATVGLATLAELG
jgi:hypothetical protein